MTNKFQSIVIDEDTRIAYQQIGNYDNDLPILIFLHEGLGSIEQWKGFPETLCEETNLPGLVYDRPGYGYSSRLDEPFEVEFMHHEAQSILPKIIKELNIEHKQIICVGHSDGGSIALLYSAWNTDKVLGCVTIAAHIFVEDITVKSISEITDRYRKEEEFRKAVNKYHPGHGDATFNRWSDIWLSEAFYHWNIEEFLCDIHTPLLILQGANDQYGTDEQLEAIFHGAESALINGHIIPDAEHSPHLQNKTVTLATICKFVERLKTL